MISLNLFGRKKTTEEQITSTSAAALAEGMLSIKDIVAPSFVEVDFNNIKVGEKYYRTLFVVGFPRFVSPNWLSPLITFDRPLYLSMFIYPTQSRDILKDLKRKIAEMEATIEGDMKAGKVVDPSIQVALDDALSLQAELAQGSERFFQFGFYITIPADTIEELNRTTKEIESIVASLLLIAKTATLEMEEGFKATLPLFIDRLRVWRNMDTTSLSSIFPFSSASLTANEGVLYGINDHDGSLVIFDRFKLESPNSVILGKSGSGKSFLVKLESVRQMVMGNDVIIVDPENEYQEIAQSVGGEFISFSISSDYKINPFELNTTGEDADELANKILNLHSLIKVIIGELNPPQDALLDRALVETYKQKGITQDMQTHKNPPPLLIDLYATLQQTNTSEAKELVDRLEKFVTGSASNMFKQHSNIDIHNKFTVFGIRDMEENLRPIAIYLILDHIWNVVRKDRKQRILVIDEAWYLVKHKDSAEYLYNFAKRARKYDLGLTTITQDVEDFLNTEEGRAILTNSSLQILLKQSSAAIEKIVDTFNITSGERHFLLSGDIGEGLFFAGQSHVTIKIIASDEEYKLVTRT